MSSSTGKWEGQVFKLREFACVPSNGTVKGVDYLQTMGKMTLRYVLPDEVAHLSSSDLTVELSSSELKVQAAGCPELNGHFSVISGDLQGEVKRELSWWTLERESDGNVFTIDLVKREHKAWNAVWKLGMKNHRKSHFAWTPSAKAPLKKAEEMLVKVKPGRLRENAQDRFTIAREDLCSALEDGQDDSTAIIRIHLDRSALEKACESVCLADLFGLDVMERYLKVFIRGDERSPILLGQLHGKIVPEKTRWEIMKALAPPDFNEDEEQATERKRVGQYNTCLQVTLVKLKQSNKHWPRLLDENEQALARDAAPAIEVLKAKAIREASPDRTGWTPQDHAREMKTKADACFKTSSWRDASVLYTKAIDRTPDDGKLYSNRSACFFKMKKYDKALADARKCASLNPNWAKAYFRQGQAFRGLRQWDDAFNAFKEGRFRDAGNPDWEKEIEKTEVEQAKWEEFRREQRKQKREADMTTELNEATVVAEREAMVAVAEQALRAGKSQKEAGELALKGAELAKQRIHEMASQKKKQQAMMLENDDELDEAPPYRIVREDGALHHKGFAHTDKGMYFMGMTLMNYNKAPETQPWIEIRHPGKLRWSQGCALVRLKVTLPESVGSAADLEVTVTTTTLHIRTAKDSDPIIIGEFDKKVEPEGENFCWYLVPDEKPPMLEMCLDKDHSEVYTTYSYGSLLWPRLFKDDIPLGEGLFEADLTDLPPDLLEKFQREQARSNQASVDERNRRKMMTEEEIAEETARNWNDEFARHGMPQRVDTNEDKILERYRSS
eukprot:TRINITY_DN97422_c0_g1_i1.p1 TRINITY_DN97422_c0_g1~~TRINITY_DN97422_c0_g1_i1.p1  ORF type:complete len:801 (+),score=186.00 TRINITY_DN97422_c0_g1_i1:49-2403(+)